MVIGWLIITKWVANNKGLGSSPVGVERGVGVGGDGPTGRAAHVMLRCRCCSGHHGNQEHGHNRPWKHSSASHLLVFFRSPLFFFLYDQYSSTSLSLLIVHCWEMGWCLYGSRRGEWWAIKSMGSLVVGWPEPNLTWTDATGRGCVWLLYPCETKGPLSQLGGSVPVLEFSLLLTPATNFIAAFSILLITPVQCALILENY